MAHNDMAEQDDPFIEAGKYSLRVLEGDELVQAQRKILTDPEFARAVQWWDRRLGSLAEEGHAFEPSTGIKEAILARIQRENASRDRVDTLPAKTNRPSNWSIGLAAFGSAMATAAFVLFVSGPAITIPAEPAAVQRSGETLIAQLRSEDGTTSLASVIDLESDLLSVRLTGLEPEPGRAAELWVIPAGGEPQSLGAIPRSGKLERTITGAEKAVLAEGSSLAITVEQDIGVPHETPTPPILLVGSIGSV